MPGPPLRQIRHVARPARLFAAGSVAAVALATAASSAAAPTEKTISGIHIFIDQGGYGSATLHAAPDPGMHTLRFIEVQLTCNSGHGKVKVTAAPDDIGTITFCRRGISGSTAVAGPKKFAIPQTVTIKAPKSLHWQLYVASRTHAPKATH